MTTVTGLTADRMLAIEAASVIDGDIVGDNLILTTKGGSQIDAGNVRGPVGPEGPVGSDLIAGATLPVLAVGMPGQIRAGRQLTAADFTNMGLNVPVGIWNLSDLTDVSGNGRNLSNKGSVINITGINGLPGTAAKFIGSTAQALYISDTGVNDSLRIKTGSWGCWSKTAKQQSTAQALIGKWGLSGQLSWMIWIDGSGNASVYISLTGADSYNTYATTPINDDCWHFIVATFDGSMLRIYVDGNLCNKSAVRGVIYSGVSPFNIGGHAADASTAAGTPNYGRIDEAFVTADVLSEEQIRLLYCSKISHTLGVVPSRVSVNVEQRRIGAALTPADFPIPPLRLYNFSGGSLGDEGTNNATLTNVGSAISSAGVDGTPNNAYNFNLNNYLEATDAGLPQGPAPRSYGCWFKTTFNQSYQTLIGWGVGLIRMTSDGKIEFWSGSNGLTAGIGLNDGLWHQVVSVEDPSGATDVTKTKLYLDGRLLGSTDVISSTAALGGKFYMAADNSGIYRVAGILDAAFVIAKALTAEEILKVYLKSGMSLGISPKNSGDHVERMTSGELLTCFDSLAPQHQVDLRVAA